MSFHDPYEPGVLKLNNHRSNDDNKVYENDDNNHNNNDDQNNSNRIDAGDASKNSKNRNNYFFKPIQTFIKSVSSRSFTIFASPADWAMESAGDATIVNERMDTDLINIWIDFYVSLFLFLLLLLASLASILLLLC